MSGARVSRPAPRTATGLPALVGAPRYRRARSRRWYAVRSIVRGLVYVAAAVGLMFILWGLIIAVTLIGEGMHAPLPTDIQLPTI